MKSFRKALTLVLAAVMLFALCCPVIAADEKGSITITNATVDQTYAAYKVFDLTYDEDGNVAYTYTKSGDTDKLYAALIDDDSPFTLEENVFGSYNVSAKTDIDGEDIGTWLTTNVKLLGTAAASTKATSDSVKFENLDLGYYYITSTLGTVITLDSTTPDVEVIDKNQEPGGDFEKWIIVNDKKVKTSNANVGDKVDFEIDFDASNYDGEDIITNYFVYDNMSAALVYNGDVKVKVGTKTLTSSDYEIVTNKTLSGTTYDFVINIPWVNAKGEFLYGANEEVVVTYSATVNEKFATGVSMDNNATYDFRSIPKDEDDEDEKKPAEIKDVPAPTKTVVTTKTYTAGIKIVKVDDNGDALTGAKFKISGLSSPVVLTNSEVFVEATTGGTYWKLKDGKYTADAPVLADRFDPVADDYDRQDGGYVESTTTPGTYVAATQEQLDDDKIPLFIKVLANTDLYDSTTKKYKKITTVTKDDVAGDPVDVEEWVDKDGYLVITGLGTGEYTITEIVAPDGYNILTDAIKVKLDFVLEDAETPKTGEFEASVDGVKQTMTDAIVTIEVTNNKGTVLPSTGGSGTILLVVLGSLLFMATAVVLVTKKRMYNEG